MEKKLLFVFNPHSGKAQIKNNLLDIVDIFVKANYEVTVYPTQCRHDAYRIVKDKSQYFDIVVCCGGDGTLNETVKGIMRSDVRTLLGYIPAGTTNDFAYSLNISKNMKKAASTIVNGVPFACDIGSLNGLNFTYIAAFGAFTEVSYQTPQQSKNAFGHLAYVLEGIKRLPSIKSYKLRIEHDGKVVEDEFIIGFISNTISVGGYRKLSEFGIVLDDGLFEVTFIKMPNNPFDLQSILSSFAHQDLSSSYFYAFKTSSLKITSQEDLEWTLDGESGGSHKEIFIENYKQAIEIIVNRKKID